MNIKQLMRTCCIVTAACLLAIPAQGADVFMTANDPFEESSFNTAGQWSNAAPPSAGNNYFTRNSADNAYFTLRTPDSGDSFSFAGDSLTVRTATGAVGDYSTGLFYKGLGTGGVITINNLILDRGLISHAQGTTDLFQLDGNISVVGPSTIYSKQGHTDILAPISGSANLTIAATDDNADAAQRIVTLMGNNNYTGNIDVLGKLHLGETGSLAFNIGSSGVNNAISGTGITEFRGVFDFNLSGASSNPGDSWSIVNTSSFSFGETFSVPGFTQMGTLWTSGPYLFNPDTGVLSVSSPPVQWGIDGGGNWNAGSNWFGGSVPGTGSDVLFGTVLTAANAPATVNFNANANVSSMTFSNANQYILSGNNTLTLSGLAQLSSTAGTHEVDVVVAGNAGLTKTGGGGIILSANNSYSGLTSVQQGQLRLRHNSAVNGAVNVESGATLFFEGDGEGGGFNGNFAGNISGAGQVATATNLTTETVTFNSAKSYSGETVINGGTLQLTGSGTLGTSDGTVAARTLVAGNLNTGTLALSGGVAVGNELLVLGAREGAAFDAIHLTSSGNNSWAGNIKGELGGTQYNLESTSGTLTLGGTISAPDTNVRNFVFSGAGNFNITGKLVDTETNEVGADPPLPVNNLNNVNVVKRGAGTLTVSTGTNGVDDFWRGTTVIEEGRLLVTAGGVLRSSLIDVRSGAIFEVGAAGYSIQPGQDLVGGGEVRGQLIRAFGDSLVSPGDDGVGTLTFRGPGGSGNANLLIGSDYFDAFGPRGGLAFDLGSTTTVGGGVNDLITGVNNLTLDIQQFDDNFNPLGIDSPIEVMVTPAAGTLSSGTYRLIEYSGALAREGNGSTSDANLFDVQLQGISGPIRQTLAVSTATPGQVNLVVSGSSATQTWNGTAGNNQWNVNSAPNWTGTGNTFFQLDNVVFNDSAANKTVNVAENVQPGSVTFHSNSGSTYTVTGSQGIKTGGPVALTGNVTVALENEGNELTGNVNLASGTTLSAGNGTVLGNVNLTSGGTLRVGAAGLEPVLQITDVTYVDAVAGGNTTLADGSPFVPAPQGTQPPENWMIREPFGNSGSIYQAGGTETTNAPVLRTTITGLTPNTEYVVHVNFWDATGSSWRIQGGASPSELTLFGAPADAIPGATDGIDAGTLTYIGTPPLTSEGNRTMFGGDLGVLMSDASGNIQVYIDDSPLPNIGDNRTWYDGLSYAANVLVPTGEVTGAETLTIDGDLILGAGSIVSLDIGQNGFNDSLSIAGNLAAAGTLVVDLASGAPALSVGDSFDLFDFGSVSGSFQSLNLPSLSANLAWNTDDLLTTGQLSVISDLPGDFDGDGIVDGHDFLAWQRNQGLGNLSDWEANFGTSTLVATSTAVPEPATWMSLLIAAAMGLSLRRR